MKTIGFLIALTTSIVALAAADLVYHPASIFFVSYSGYSNVITSSVRSAPPEFYYSNISTTTTTDGGTAALVYEDAVTAGTTCSVALNPNCKNPSDNFSVTVKSNAPVTGGANYMYLIYTGSTAPTAGSPLSEYTQIVPQQLFAPREGVTFETTWGNICSKIAGSGEPIIGLGSNCEDTGIAADPAVVRGPRTATLYVVADANSTGLVGNEVQAFNVTFASSIPVYSSIADQTGFYGFQMIPGDRAAVIQGATGTAGVMTDTDFPNQTVEDSVAVQALRLYYVGVPTSHGAPAVYDPKYFSSLSPLANPATQFRDIAVSPDGSLAGNRIEGLDNGVMYYFRAALVDYAGNVGYLTSASDDGVGHTAIHYPLRAHYGRLLRH